MSADIELAGGAQKLLPDRVISIVIFGIPIFEDKNE
jgi:hypothetical protein